MNSKIRKISTGSHQSNGGLTLIEQVYRKYFDRLFSYARVICESEEVAKDVVSDFFYELLKKNTDLSKVKNLEVYLAVGVKNLCIQRLMKASKVEKNAVLIATIDYIANGGDNCAFLKDKKQWATGVLFRDAIIQHVESGSQNGQSVVAKIEERVFILK